MVAAPEVCDHGSVGQVSLPLYCTEQACFLRLYITHILSLQASALMDQCAHRPMRSLASALIRQCLDGQLITWY